MNIKKLLSLRRLALRKTGHLYQVRSKIGTVYQSHDLESIASWVRYAPRYLTADIDYKQINDTICPVKYGRVTTRP